MSLPDLEILHDCLLRDLRYDVSSAETRTLVLVLECPEDMGKSEWDGQTLRVTAVDVVLFRLTAWGHCWGHETLDAWRDGVSAPTRAELARLPGPPPSVTATVTFHSGTLFELACRQVIVDVVERRPGASGVGVQPLALEPGTTAQGARKS